MSYGNALTTARVLGLFSEEVTQHGGTVTDAFDDGERLFARATLPQAEEVRTNDLLQGGVALKVSGRELLVYPYVFRKVCRNGAIMAHALASRRVKLDIERDEGEVVSELQEAVQGCCAAEVFEINREQIRLTQFAAPDSGLALLPLMTRLSGHTNAPLIKRILQQFIDGGDRTRFGIMNAVTAVARDTADPQVRWDLEEHGGEIAVGLTGPKPRMPVRSVARAFSA